MSELWKAVVAVLAVLAAAAMAAFLLQPLGFLEPGEEEPMEGGDGLVVAERSSVRTTGGSVAVNAVVENTGGRSEEATLRAEVEVYGEVYRRNTTIGLGPGERGRYSVVFPLPEHGYVEAYEYRVWIE